MAAQIKIKRSNISSKLPVVGDLELGELAINTFDGKLFLKKNNGTESIVEIGASGATANTGTVTSVAALTLATTGTDISSSVANGTTTPVITLNIPTASADNRGALSAADWSTFNNKQAAGTYATGTGSASGTNTGDETTETIKTKLSISTLSGSNTGDETTETIKTKLSISTLSGSNTGDQTIPTTLPNANAVTFTTSGGAAAGSTYTGAAVLTVDYSTVGAAASGHTHSYQAADGDLLAIGGLTGTTGLLKKTDVDTWTLDTTAYTTNTGTVTGVTATAPVASTGGTAPVISMAAASSGVDGYMTGAYATKLDGIAASATANTGTVTGVTGTAPIVSSGGTAPAISISAATTSAAGSMSATDKTKLDGIASGATNVTNNNQLTNGAGYTTNTGTVTGVTGTAPVVSSGGTAPAISMAAASSGVDGYMTGAYATKLDGIASGATANTGTVTGVTGTAPVVSSGGAAPAISMAAASSGVDGYMTGAYATKLDGIASGATNVTNTNQLTNGAGYTTNTGTVTSVSGTGTVSGLTLSGTVTSSGSLTLGGSISFPVTSVNGLTGAVTIAVAKKQEFTATAAQTTFTITNGYAVGSVQVFANGIALAAADYTATNGTTVVLTEGRVAGDNIIVSSGGTFQAGGVPAGTITMITNMATLPTGYLECNGSEISQASYPQLVGMVPIFQVYTPSASSVTLFNNNWSSNAGIVDPAVLHSANFNVFLSSNPPPDYLGGLFLALEINFSSAVTVDSAALFAAGMGQIPTIWELRALPSNTVVLTKNAPAYIQDDASSVAQYSNPANFTNVSTVVTSASYGLYIGANIGYATDIGFTKFILRARLANPGSLYLPTATSITSSITVRPIMKF